MAPFPDNEEPGFEHDVTELDKKRDNGAEDTLEDQPDKADEMEQVQQDAAEERKEGGYQ